MEIRPRLQDAKSKFREAGINEIDAEILFAHLLGMSRMDLHNSVKVEQRISELSSLADLFDDFEHVCNRRISGVPVQYITGVAYFHNVTLSVGPGVLVPRPETEAIAESVLTHVGSTTTPISVVDLGAGSGALAIAIATQAPNTRVVAVEKDPGALVFLKRNIAACDAEISVIEEDVATALQGVKADIVVANPPYIRDGEPLPRDVAEHEPAIALFGGPSGMEVPKVFITSAARILKSGGLLLIEHGEDQAEPISDALSGDFIGIKAHLDHNGRARWTSAERK
jgi:release factor glutamine methyltransferase